MPKTDSPPHRLTPPATRDHCLGSPSATVSLVEYAEYESLPCAEANWVVKELVRELGDELCFVFRNFPVASAHPHAPAAAEAAEAADAQGKFWLMHDRLFEHRAELDPAHLTAYAREISLDIATFERDLRSGTPARRVAEDVESGRAAGVERTPTFFANGRLYSGPIEFLPLLKTLKGPDMDHDRFDR
ncbi:MAG: DsbA family protein [Thermoplasmata archaeon]|nr:DsbA family protein [Thermoplasmata archaeon]